MLVLAIPVDLDKLLEDSRLTPITALRKACRVMIVAVNIPTMFVVAVLGAESSGTDGACEVIDMIFALYGGDIGAS